MRRKKSRSERLALATVLVLSFSLVGVLGQRQYVRATTQETWVAAKPLSAGQVVGRGDLAPGRVNGSSPPGMVAQLDQIVGRRLAVDKAEGEAFGATDFVPEERPWLAAMVPEGRVIYTMVPDRYLLPYSRQLRGGDRFDILITAAGGRVHPLAFDVILLGVLKDTNGTQKEPQGRGLLSALASPNAGDASDGESHLLVLAVKPEHVLSLASAQGAPGRISFVVHGQNEVREGKRLAVIPPKRSVEIVAGLDRSRVTVAR